MSADWKGSLRGMADQKRITEIDVTPVPAPPTSSHPGEHLFANCHYNACMTVLPRQELLDLARADSVTILRRLATQQRTQNIVSFVVTVYGHFPIPGASRPARRRIYRVNVPCEALPADASLITLTFLNRPGAVQSFELDELEETLN